MDLLTMSTCWIMDIGMLGMWRLHAWRYWRLVAAVLMIQQWQWLADHSDLALMSAYFTWKIASCLAVHLCYLVRCLWFLYTCFWLIMLWSSTKKYCPVLWIFATLVQVVSSCNIWILVLAFPLLCSEGVKSDWHCIFGTQIYHGSYTHTHTPV